jgi:hypothetical protein
VQKIKKEYGYYSAFVVLKKENRINGNFESCGPLSRTNSFSCPYLYINTALQGNNTRMFTVGATRYIFTGLLEISLFNHVVNAGTRYE